MIKKSLRENELNINFGTDEEMISDLERIGVNRR